MTDIMKLRKIFTLSLAALALAGCADDKFAFDKNGEGKGTLSFAGLSIDYSEEMVTRAEAADGTYMLYVYDSVPVLLCLLICLVFKILRISEIIYLSFSV